jgi:putative ABC transport system permease protein
MRSFARGRLFIPIDVAEKLNVLQTSALRDVVRADAAETVYTSLLVRVSNPVRVAAVQDAIKKMGFTTWSMLDAARNLRVVFAIFDTFLGAFGSLALAVASLGIVNTLVMAILERRREIGIMKALGASDRDVKQIFFAEAGAMGLAGGALGVLLGWAIGQLINFGVALWLQRQDLPPQQIWATPLWLVASAIAFSVLVSLVAGLFPASRAAKLDPVQALRYE